MEIRLKKNVLKGFTLVEILVVIAILGLSTSALLYFLTSTIKSSNQSNIIQEVQQNGQTVLNNLTSQIESGISASNCVSGVTDCLLVQTPANNSLYIKYFPEVSGTSNGYIAICNDSTCTGGSPNYVSLTNQDVVSGVSVIPSLSMPIFSVYSASGVPSVVTINFTLKQAVNATSRQDFQAIIPFQTIVTLRAY